MQRVFSGATALLLAGCALAMPAIAAPDAPLPHDVRSRVEEFMAARVERDRFSGSVLIARAGRVIFSEGYGMASRELDVPCTPQTKYRLGSITKQFTAMAVLILQERGKLDIADPVKKHMPDAPKAWEPITIHNLLTHTAGIPNYTSLPDFARTMRDRVTLAQQIARFKDKPLEFKPGERFKYSNSGYSVLGRIIETASGKSYAAFVKEAIFDPLEMHDSGYDSTRMSSRIEPRDIPALRGTQLLIHLILTCLYRMRRVHCIRRRSICSSGIARSRQRDSSRRNPWPRCSRLSSTATLTAGRSTRSIARPARNTTAASRGSQP